jgi:hypothetical protein
MFAMFFERTPTRYCVWFTCGAHRRLRSQVVVNASLGGGGAGLHGESSTRAACQQHSDGDGFSGGPRHVFSALDAVDGDDGEEGVDALVRMLRVRCALSGKQ